TPLRYSRRAGEESLAGGVAPPRNAAVDLYWLPLGAGGQFVRLNGRVHEALAARLQRRPACDLYSVNLRPPGPQPDGSRHIRAIRRRRGEAQLIRIDVSLPWVGLRMDVLRGVRGGAPPPRTIVRLPPATRPPRSPR